MRASPGTVHLEPVEGEPAGLEAALERFPPRLFERGETLIRPRAGDPPSLGFVVEGLVRGLWFGSDLAPGCRSTATIAGDGRWFGADAFRAGENLFRYDAMAPTMAAIVPLRWLQEEAPRGVLLEALHRVSLDWCTAVSVLSHGRRTLERRVLLLLFDLSRLHPRPELEVRQQDIAELLGVGRSTLAPVLKRLESRGLVGLGYGEMAVTDPDRLLAALGGGPGARNGNG